MVDRFLEKVYLLAYDMNSNFQLLAFLRSLGVLRLLVSRQSPLSLSLLLKDEGLISLELISNLLILLWLL